MAYAYIADSSESLTQPRTLLGLGLRRNFARLTPIRFLHPIPLAYNPTLILKGSAHLTHLILSRSQHEN